MGASLLATFLVLCFAATPVHASELTDLGEGLSYLRVHTLDESAKDLAAAIRERSSLVLDLRHLTATTESAEQFGTAFVAREAKPPVFVLVSPATPPVLTDSLKSTGGKCVTLGVKESVPMPQVVIDQSPDTDRRAYEALESGQSLAGLISGKISKERYDEAALMKEFINGNTNAATAPDPTTKPADADKGPPSATNAGDKPAVNAPEKLIDRVLQRAVHLHRALAAIKQR